MEAFTTAISSVVTVIQNSLSIFLEPPMIFFVALAGAAAVFALIKRHLVMTKRG